MACCAVFCTSRTLKGGVKVPDLSFHTFPKSPELREKWIKAVRRNNWEPNKFSRLCSKHFEKSSFVNGLSIKRLASDAVPTIFEGYPKYYQPVAKKERKQRNRDENLDVPPKIQKKLDACGFKIEDHPTSLSYSYILNCLSKTQKLAWRRLNLIKALRISRCRLIKKNAQLLYIINHLKSRILVDA